MVNGADDVYVEWEGRMEKMHLVAKPQLVQRPPGGQ